MKCSNCGTEFGEGMFCPECGTKYKGALQDYGRETIKEKEEAERLARERVEAERLAKKIELEKITQDNLKRGIDMRTVRGTVYKTLDEAELAKDEHNKIDVLKTQLLGTKSQKKRQKIFGTFTETITTIDAKNRYELLKEKILRKVPLSEIINCIYGITVLFAFIIVIIGSVLKDVSTSIFLMVSAGWAGFGIWIWTIWKVVLLIKSMGKNYYKNIKNI